jgi:hypothetical protein
MSEDKKYITPEKSKTAFRSTVDTRKSVEVSYLQLILKDYVKNMVKSFSNIHERLNEVN